MTTHNNELFTNKNGDHYDRLEMSWQQLESYILDCTIFRYYKLPLRQGILVSATALGFNVKYSNDEYDFFISFDRKPFDTHIFKGDMAYGLAFEFLLSKIAFKAINYPHEVNDWTLSQINALGFGNVYYSNLWKV